MSVIMRPPGIIEMARRARALNLCRANTVIVTRLVHPTCQRCSRHQGPESFFRGAVIIQQDSSRRTHWWRMTWEQHEGRTQILYGLITHAERVGYNILARVGSAGCVSSNVRLRRYQHKSRALMLTKHHNFLRRSQKNKHPVTCADSRI